MFFLTLGEAQQILGQRMPVFVAALQHAVAAWVNDFWHPPRCPERVFPRVDNMRSMV